VKAATTPLVVLLASCCVSMLAVRVCEGRTWHDVVDASIYLASAIDIGRLERALERDPFDFSSVPTTTTTTAPNTDTESETEDDANDNDDNGSNNNSSKNKNNNGNGNNQRTPTFAPSARYDFIVGNGGCPVGKSLYEVRMTDAWGDGWDESRLRIVERVAAPQVDEGLTITADDGSQTVTVSESVSLYQQNPAVIEVYEGGLAHGSEGFDYVVRCPKYCNWVVSCHFPSFLRSIPYKRDTFAFPFLFSFLQCGTVPRSVGVLHGVGTRREVGRRN